VGIAAYAARGKQYVVMVRPHEDGLVMHQLRYPDEIKPWSEVPMGKLAKPAPSELGLAAKVIEGLRHDTFDPKQYKDEVKGRVRKLIAQKAKTGEITIPESAPQETTEAVDLMAALKASLGGGGEKKSTKRSAHPRKSAARAHRTSTARKPAKRATHRAAPRKTARRAHA
jgi:DNA end-binding protein Ku